MVKRNYLISVLSVVLLGVSAIVAAALNQDQLSDVFFFAMFFALGLSFIFREKDGQVKTKTIEIIVGILLIAYAVIRCALMILK